MKEPLFLRDVDEWVRLMDADHPMTFTYRPGPEELVEVKGTHPRLAKVATRPVRGLLWLAAQADRLADWLEWKSDDACHAVHRWRGYSYHSPPRSVKFESSLTNYPTMEEDDE